MMGLHVCLPLWLLLSYLFPLAWQLNTRKPGFISNVLGRHQRTGQHYHWENAFWLLAAFVWILGIWIIRIDRSDTHLLWCWPFSVTQERAMCGSLTHFNSLQMGPAFLPSFLCHCSFFCIWGVGGVGSRSHYVAQVGPSCLHFPNAGVMERPVPLHGSCPALIFLFAGCVCVVGGVFRTVGSLGQCW